MVRTRADVGSARVTAAKAPRKAAGGGSGACASPAGKGGSSKEKFSGGNSYNPQPVPSWQKGISAFLKPAPAPLTTGSKQETSSSDFASGSSSSSSECGSGSSSGGGSSSNDSI